MSSNEGYSEGYSGDGGDGEGRSLSGNVERWERCVRACLHLPTAEHVLFPHSSGLLARSCSAWGAARNTMPCPALRLGKL